MAKYETSGEDKTLQDFYNTVKEEIKDKVVISNAKDIIKDNMDLQLAKIEHLRVIFFDSSNRKLGTIQFKGVANQCLAYNIKIVKKAIKLNASSAVMLHNHPAKTGVFSNSDINITRKIFVALKSIDIELLDHILLYGIGHQSMRDTTYWNAVSKSFL